MSTASDLLAFYVKAEIKILSGQQVRDHKMRMLTMADLETVRAERVRLERRVQAEANGGDISRAQVADFTTSDNSGWPSSSRPWRR